MPDLINHPPHYKLPNGLECIDVIEALALPYRLGNVLKYLWRAGRKDAALSDLKKAQWYLSREITKREAQEATSHDPKPTNNPLSHANVEPATSCNPSNPSITISFTEAGHSHGEETGSIGGRMGLTISAGEGETPAEAQEAVHTLIAELSTRARAGGTVVQAVYGYINEWQSTSARGNTGLDSRDKAAIESAIGALNTVRATQTVAFDVLSYIFDLKAVLQRASQ